MTLWPKSGRIGQKKPNWALISSHFLEILKHSSCCARPPIRLVYYTDPLITWVGLLELLHALLPLRPGPHCEWTNCWNCNTAWNLLLPYSTPLRPCKWLLFAFIDLLLQFGLHLRICQLQMAKSSQWMYVKTERSKLSIVRDLRSPSGIPPKSLSSMPLVLWPECSAFYIWSTSSSSSSLASLPMKDY